MNNNEDSEQAQNCVSEFGKFDDAKQLLKAYKALEQEFTKRCQKLKELEDNFDVLSKSVQEAEKAAKTEALTEEFIESRILNNDYIIQKVISDYLINLGRRQNTPLLGSDYGLSALSPVNKPKNLTEAKMLADKLLR